jgi:hypothetical protein
MNKTFTFEYRVAEDGDDDRVPYPVYSNLNATHEFHDACTWDVVLWQFCKFLEHSGYIGITERVVLKDPLGLMGMNHLFETIGNDRFPFDEEDWDDTEEEDEDTTEEEKEND